MAQTPDDLNANTTREQLIYLTELRSYVHEEAGWIRTLTEAIQEGVAGRQTATEVGQAVADVAAPYRAEIARVRNLSVPPGCEAVERALEAETAAAGAYLSGLGRWTAAGQTGIDLLRENAGEDVGRVLAEFLAARDDFEAAFTEAARLLEPPSGQA